LCFAVDASDEIVNRYCKLLVPTQSPVQPTGGCSRLANSGGRSVPTPKIPRGNSAQGAMDAATKIWPLFGKFNAQFAAGEVGTAGAVHQYTTGDGRGMSGTAEHWTSATGCRQCKHTSEVLHPLTRGAVAT
jgi:hypothetical protein